MQKHQGTGQTGGFDNGTGALFFQTLHETASAGDAEIQYFIMPVNCGEPGCLAVARSHAPASALQELEEGQVAFARRNPER